MKLYLVMKFSLGLLVAGLLVGTSPFGAAAELLISDRVNNAVHRYTVDGEYIATLLKDDVNLLQPSGIQLSPDFRKLYVASSGNSQVVVYDYNYKAGTATNPTVFADGGDGLAFPNSVLFSQDGQRVYVSNLGGSGVAQFNLDGSVAAAPIDGPIAGGSIFQYSGLAFAPTGELLVGGFQDFPAGLAGAVARSDGGLTTISDFIGPSMLLNGASNLLVHGNDLYVTAGYAGTVNRFDATTGAIDPGFSIDGLIFPASMTLAPDGNGILIGVLGMDAGLGSILRFGFDGTLIEEFATGTLLPNAGFAEATGMLHVAVPEPATWGMIGISIVSFACFARRHLG